MELTLKEEYQVILCMQMGTVIFPYNYYSQFYHHFYKQVL